MGKGRDKRKKHEDPTKVLKRNERQATKAARGEARLKDETGVDGADGTNLGGLNNEEDIALTVARIKKLEMKRKRIEELDVPYPNPRANSMIVKHPTRDNEIVTFGGEVWDGEKTRPFNDLLIYSLQKRQWRQLLSPGGPSPRSSCQLFTYKQFVFVHGGEFVSPTQSQYLHFRDCFRVDMNTGVWEQLAVGGKGQGACPSARSGHRVALWKRSAVLFGGFYDNALESRYYDDLWVLSELEGDGQWTAVHIPPHAEKPHPRSGHTIAVHKDEVFVYGGYYINKVSRFQKAEATVFHDLWMINLGTNMPLWQKVKLAGIPPPIRAGVGAAVKDKRIIFFGGVVDLDGPGGRTLSNFTNDLFAFHMDTKKFFPMLLKAGKMKPGGKAGDEGGEGKNDLAAEVAAVIGGSDSDDEDDFGQSSAGAAQKAPGLTAEGLAALEEPKTSDVRLPTGQVIPCARMNAMLAVVDTQLVVFGGQYEVGKKEVTLCDLYTLNINRLDTFQCHHSQDLTKVDWRGEPSEASGSWEDGSTVLSVNSNVDEDEDEDEESESEEEGSAPVRAGPRAAGQSKDESSDEEDSDSDDQDGDGAAHPAGSVGSKLAEKVLNDAAAVDCDARVNIKGKASLQKHKEQLQQQLSASNAVPAPHGVGESPAAFFERTKAFWLQQAGEALGVDVDDEDALNSRAVRREAINYAKMRYAEATALLKQLTEIEEQQRAEKEVIKAHLEAKRMRREAEEAAASDEDAAPQAIPAADEQKQSQ
jgi:hypothetical protein